MESVLATDICRSCSSPSCTPKAQPWIVTFWPLAQASTITVLTHTFTTCSITFRSTSTSARLSSGISSSRLRWRSRTSWMWRIQLSARPMRSPCSAASTPPQP